MGELAGSPAIASLLVQIPGPSESGLPSSGPGGQARDSLVFDVARTADAHRTKASDAKRSARHAEPPAPRKDGFEPIPYPLQPESVASRPLDILRRPDSQIPPIDLRWCGRRETVSVGPYVLRDPFVYVAPGNARDREASCIGIDLPIGRPTDESGDRLSYEPQYGALSPGQRGNYLRWLEGGRRTPLDDIGYAFLFFYGLERRLLVDGEDFSPIVKEVVRLLEAYTSSGSFDGYLSRFLSYSLARAGIGTLKDKWFEAVFERTRAQRDEQHLAVGLAWLYMRGVPLPSDWALRIARLDPRAARSVVVDRLADRFRELFGRRYHERFGGGMSLDCAGSDLHVTYRPANPTLRHLSLYSGRFNPVTVPNVMGLRSQFDPLVEIWSVCIDELKPLSRVVARGANVSSREAYEALPEDLKPSVEHPDKPQWDRLASECRREDGFVLVDVGRLASIQGLEERA